MSSYRLTTPVTLGQGTVTPPSLITLLNINNTDESSGTNWLCLSGADFGEFTTSNEGIAFLNYNNTSGDRTLWIGDSEFVTSASGGQILQIEFNKAAETVTITNSPGAGASTSNLSINSIHNLNLTADTTLTLNAPTVTFSVTTLNLGTVTTGTWNGSNIGLAYGGTNASLTAINGGVIYSTASAMAISAAGTSGQLLQSAGAGTPTWVTLSSIGVTSITGTANEITASASTGAVTLSISSTYIGQTSITTLGTIGTGTWQGGVIQPTYGGTGVNNGSNTLTVNANSTINQNVSTTASPLFATETISPGGAVTAPTITTILNINANADLTAGIVLSGKDYIGDATLTNGVVLTLGRNQSNNKALFIGDSSNFSYGPSGNMALSLGVQQGSGSYIDALTTSLGAGQLFLNGNGGGTVYIGATSYPKTILSGQLLYGSTADAVLPLPTANNGVLITSGAGLPSIGSTLPSAVQSNITTVGTITTGVWTGTNIALANGGTNASLTATNGGIVYSTASAMAISAAGTSGQLLQSAGAGAPTWVTLSSIGVTSITGTANEITASASTGAVTLSISSTYIGQTSITTLGTITTGTWAGTAIANAHLANSTIVVNGVTLTLGDTSDTVPVNVTGSTTNTAFGLLFATATNGNQSALFDNTGTNNLTYNPSTQTLTAGLSMTIGSTGGLTGITMNNSVASYSPSVLNYYEEYTASAAGSNAASGFTLTVYLRRIGRLVIFGWPSLVISSAASSSTCLFSAAIPTRFYPENNVFGVYVAILAGTQLMSQVEIVASSGNVVFSYGFGNFTSGETITLDNNGISWIRIASQD